MQPIKHEAAGASPNIWVLGELGAMTENPNFGPFLRSLVKWLWHYIWKSQELRYAWSWRFFRGRTDKCDLTRTGLQSRARTHSQIGRQILESGEKFSYCWIIMGLNTFTWKLMWNIWEPINIASPTSENRDSQHPVAVLAVFSLRFIAQLIPAEAERETLGGGKRQQILARYKCCHFVGIE